jgi:hypothetical protein
MLAHLTLSIWKRPLTNDRSQAPDSEQGETALHLQSQTNPHLRGGVFLGYEVVVAL